MNTKIVKIFIFLSVIAYWYNIGVMEYSISGTQELRLYDFTFAPLIYAFIKYKNKKLVFDNFIFIKYFYYFIVLVTISMIVVLLFSVYLGNVFRFFQNIVHLYHGWGFFVTSFLILVFIRDLKFYQNLLYLLIGIMFIHNLLLLCQYMGILDTFWSERWTRMYGTYYYTGTLGLNKVVPAFFAFISVVFSIFTIVTTRKNVKYYTILRFLSIWNLITSFVLIIIIGSKTTWVSTVIFLIILLLKDIRKIVIYSLVAVSILFLSTLVNSFDVIPEKIKERASDVYKRRIDKDNKKLEQEEEDQEQNVFDFYKAHSTGRGGYIERYLVFIYENPHIIIFGTGFYNQKNVTNIVSAHNMYLTLLVELGIVGVIIYFSWFFYMIRFCKDSPLNFSFVLTVFLSLFMGEHIYFYRSSYGITGYFILVFILINHNKIIKIWNSH